jgi:NodT family efflux transporter outer membrane factor (OMF) lipoprotein
LTQSLYNLGIDDQISVVEAQTTLQSAQAGATNVKIARAQYEHAIAVLVGKAASGFSIPVKPMTTAPPPIPVGVPSELLERRPDVAAAERTMAEANAQIGIAYAAYYPNLTLTGEGGFQSSSLSHWLSWPSRFFSVGASMSETVFDAGLRRATVQQYVATYNADLASYRQTVLTAFQQVEDALAEVRIFSKEVQQEQDAVSSAQTYLKLEESRYETGIDPYIDVLIAQTTVLADQQTLNNLEVQEMTSSVALVEALGGGWDRSQLPGPAQVTQKPDKADTTIQSDTGVQP